MCAQGQDPHVRDELGIVARMARVAYACTSDKRTP